MSQEFRSEADTAETVAHDSALENAWLSDQSIRNAPDGQLLSNLRITRSLPILTIVRTRAACRFRAIDLQTWNAEGLAVPTIGIQVSPRRDSSSFGVGANDLDDKGAVKRRNRSRRGSALMSARPKRAKRKSRTSFLARGLQPTATGCAGAWVPCPGRAIPRKSSDSSSGHAVVVL